MAIALTAPVAADQDLGAADQARLDRAIEVSTRRLDEWLGPSSVAAPSIQPPRAFWPAPSSMELESQAAFQMARARFSRIADADPLRAGLAWHLQSRIVEELFDYAQHQPGHHADEVRLFGDHVRWGVPTLVLSREARDDRARPGRAHAAAAVATLERVVGWPALAGALRVLAADPRPSIDRAAVKEILESSLGIPLDWFFAALEPGFRINLSLQSVVTEAAPCQEGQCSKTAITVAREGPPLFPDGSIRQAIPIVIGFGGERRSTLSWSGTDAAQVFHVESVSPPAEVILDPDRLVRLDDNPLDQRWRAERADRPHPLRSLASWVVWLQNAVLTSGILL